MALALALVSLGPMPLRADDMTEAQLEKNRQRIARMSETERARLKRNFKAFRELSPEQQERLRNLDREIRTDDANPDNLRKTMTDYVEWIDTLSFGEREAIREKTSPADREKLVRETLKEQQRREGFMNVRRRTLSSADLDAVLQVVETAVKEQYLRTPPQLAALPSEPGLRRHIAILELAFAPQTKDGKQQVPLRRTPELVNAMIDSIGNPEQQRWAREGGPAEHTMKLFGLIIGGVWAEFEKEKPGEDELAEFLAGLDANKQNELMRFQGEWQDRHLIRLFMEAHPERYPPMPQFDQWFGFGNFGPRNRRGQRGGNEGPGQRRSGKPDETENKGAARPFNRGKRPAMENQPGDIPST